MSESMTNAIIIARDQTIVGGLLMERLHWRDGYRRHDWHDIDIHTEDMYICRKQVNLSVMLMSQINQSFRKRHCCKKVVVSFRKVWKLLSSNEIARKTFCHCFKLRRHVHRGNSRMQEGIKTKLIRRTHIFKDNRGICAVCIKAESAKIQIIYCCAVRIHA